jgi:mRNA interferase MazF
MIRRGEIYLAKLDKNASYNFSKLRPVVVFQNDFLNRALEDSGYRDVIVLPLSTRLFGSDYRLRLDPRDRLEQPCELVCNAPCTIALETLLTDDGPLTRLTEEELRKAEEKLLLIFGVLQP